MFKYIAAFGMLLCGLSAAQAADVADTSYLGSWIIASAIVAPWMPAGEMPDSTDERLLIGKTITFRPSEYTGPAPLACKNPQYKMADVPADMLFQGALGEMHAKNVYANPKTLAEGLGFTGKAWKTLKTGCAFDFHFADPATLEFALNDYIYTLKKQ